MQNLDQSSSLNDIAIIFECLHIVFLFPKNRSIVLLKIGNSRFIMKLYLTYKFNFIKNFEMCRI